MYITKQTTVLETEEILDFHRIAHPYGYEIIIGMLLSDCDRLEVHGFGPNAYFEKVKVDDNEQDVN